jgi:hypothetical protein
MGKVSQVGDDLLPGTGVGAKVLDQLPVAVGLATLLTTELRRNMVVTRAATDSSGE